MGNPPLTSLLWDWVKPKIHFFTASFYFLQIPNPFSQRIYTILFLLVAGYHVCTHLLFVFQYSSEFSELQKAQNWSNLWWLHHLYWVVYKINNKWLNQCTPILSTKHRKAPTSRVDRIFSLLESMIKKVICVFNFQYV